MPAIRGFAPCHSARGFRRLRRLLDNHGTQAQGPPNGAFKIDVENTGTIKLREIVLGLTLTQNEPKLPVALSGIDVSLELLSVLKDLVGDDINLKFNLEAVADGKNLIAIKMAP